MDLKKHIYIVRLQRVLSEGFSEVDSMVKTALKAVGCNLSYIISACLFPLKYVSLATFIPVSLVYFGFQ